MAKRTELTRDSYLIWPSLIAIFFFFSSLWIYSNYADLIFFAGILYALAIGMLGITNLFGKRFKKSVAYIIPAILFLTLTSPFFFPFRVYVINAKHYLQFMANKCNYEAEIQKMKEAGISYRKWKWGTANGGEYNLIYDESDQVMFTESKPNRNDPCSRGVLKLEPHFYVTDDFCP